MCDTLSYKQHEKGRGGKHMKTEELIQKTLAEAESVVYQIECEDYETALEMANDLCTKLRALQGK